MTINGMLQLATDLFTLRNIFIYSMTINGNSSSL